MHKIEHRKKLEIAREKLELKIMIAVRTEELHILELEKLKLKKTKRII